MKILTAAEMREVDRLSTERHGIPSLTLMENAGKSVAEFLHQRFHNLVRRRIVIVCGKGNNGGDGFVVARNLLEAGNKPTVYLFAAPDEVRGDAAVNLKRFQDISRELQIVRSPGEWQSLKAPLASAEIILDALLGTGARGPVEGLLQQVIEDVNRKRSDEVVVSVDIPSGLSADSGDPQGAAIRADHTITFTAPKPGMFAGRAAEFIGQLHVRDIGSPLELIEELGKGNLRWSEPREFSKFAAPRAAAGQKGDYGHALVVAGSVGKTGAAVLSSWAALRAGAGLVTVATPEPALSIVASHTPEIMTVPLPATNIGSIALRSLDGDLFASILKGKRALAIGPGLGTHDETQQFVRGALAKRSMLPVILDADGLNAFAGRASELKAAEQKLALTPHPGEMARLLGCEIKDVQANRLDVALKAAADWNAHVILKGHQTIIASPDGRASINSTGNPGMATAGTGDVLTGILAGLTGQYPKDDWSRELAFGVYLHGLAGDIAYADSGGAPLMASDLIRAIPRAYQKFYSECGRD
jgi:ADP-dependent NAD(P)H-hydrate dehydratase / NAD(P)H-hydrate epimerase